ncbi:MAG: 2-amino-4-hydroxy-6-hydroxymethyldihydropteridine diphosphokinase [Solirubrobacterales bacterium]
MVGYLGLGSNVGDSPANLREAERWLGEEGLVIVARASMYVTAPQGEVLDQPDFVNSALKIETHLGPQQLLELVKSIEHEMGRDPGGVRHGPRPIDIDILMLGEEPYESERLNLPHREISTRRFVLEPLLEIEPDFALPDGTRAEDLLAGVADQPVRLLEEF